MSKQLQWDDDFDWLKEHIRSSREIDAILMKAADDANKRFMKEFNERIGKRNDQENN
jgi:hypothetical protein